MTGGIIIFLSMIIHVFNYLFNILIGRILEPAEFGDVMGLWSLLAIFSIPAGAVGLIVSREVASGYNHKKLFSIISPKIFKLAIFSILICVLVSPFVYHQLLIDYLPFFIAALSVSVSYYATFFQNVLLGKELFTRYNIAGIFGAFSKLIFGAILCYVGFGVSGAAAALLISSLVVLTYSKYEAEKIAHDTEPLAQLDVKWSTMYRMLYSNFVIVLISSFDILIVKFMYDSHYAGLYASLSTISKIPLYISLAVSGAMYPVYARLTKEGSGLARRYFFSLQAFIGLFTILASAVSYLYGEFIIESFFGEKYIEIAPDLYKGFLFFGGVTLISSYLQYTLARNKFTLTISLITGIIYGVLLYVFLTNI